MTRHSPTMARDERIAALTRQGQSARAIAVMLGCTERTVTRARHRCGISQPPGMPYTPEECARIEALLDDGASYKEVARTTGRSFSGIKARWPQRSQCDAGHGARMRHLYRQLREL